MRDLSNLLLYRKSNYSLAGEDSGRLDGHHIPYPMPSGSPVLSSLSKTAYFLDPRVKHLLFS